ncbi:ATP-binding cassette domain-containing protein [Microbacterium azadirachtae]|uniref:ATP-binding cassette domain-containing protein n=1 Tax=Microbacterium azadirachtae TaxID=582680 RepID=UPI0008871498|nr:ATP-binding cassette domain-containing protein [Microbacterium azadirachtae]SDL56854.1 Cobalt transport protein [Microbacterium azadirachtae]SEF85543.1 Cobalt transport protein [Microbacterium azadirachtae]SEF87259.1 Cobalt transport protein [Microbacterium azadirachtae]
MPAVPLLRVRDLTITHRGAGAPAVRDLSFDVHAGEVVLLLGPSGSGKSTLALALAGLIPHSLEAEVTGTVAIGGHDTATTPAAVLSRQVSTVFQDPDAQIVTGSVLDEAAFALENLCLPVGEVLARAEQALRAMGLWARREENPDRLSGGGKQRLAIAAALATAAPVLILDEPTANLDPQGTAEVHAALAGIAAPERAIVLVEHDLDGAVPLATRAIVLDDTGRLAFDGPAAELLREHADALVALGVRLPTATLAARRLNERIPELAADPLPLPLTPAELAASLSRFQERCPTDFRPDPDRLRPPDAETRPPAAIITARGLDLARGGVPVLRGIDLDIAPASITAVIGPNGAGKTTLVQALAGVIPPPRGRVLVDDVDPATASPRVMASHLGFVFQNPEHQFVAHTVFDELAHGLRLRRTPPEEIAVRVAAMLDRFGLAHKADTHPYLLSGGEKRRLSVGTALIARPRILVLDEPTFGQDLRRTDELLALFRELRADGTTILLVTHDLDLVVRHTTHAVLVDDGAVVASGPTQALVRDGRIPLPAAYAAVPPPLRGLLADEPPSPASPPADPSASPLMPPSAPPRNTTQENPAPSRPQHTDTGGSPALRPEGAGSATGAADPAGAWLHGLNPLAKLGAVVPALVVLLFVRDIATPAAFLALAYGVVLTGARLSRRAWAVLLLGVPAGVLVLTAAMALWTDPSQVSASPAALRIGDWTLYTGALEAGLATGLRLAAILGLSLIPGLTTVGTDVARSAVQQLRAPYRIGYTALAAYRFVPRFGYELGVIRAAHRVRGTHGGRGPFARLARGWGYIVPLLASAIRHAERVALAMDGRAFGAYPGRTERHEVPFRTRDVVFIVLMLAASAAILIVTWRS